jgi:hypothetical protein
MFEGFAYVSTDVVGWSLVVVHWHMEQYQFVILGEFGELHALHEVEISFSVVVREIVTFGVGIHAAGMRPYPVNVCLNPMLDA